MNDKFPIVDVREDHADNQTTYVPMRVLRDGGLLPEDAGASQERAGNGCNFQSRNAACHSGIEGRIDLLNERRLRSAHAKKCAAVCDAFRTLLEVA
ncbi:hypothetical protein [Tardiphaga robiniae]|uniref:Uncharacterized protein n=1 Tax=Tardiphaga robiniae TaxID=943830 RepID=A0A7G6TVM2_9BRAD|nr:hypothetical protein [Tardiphaga robiniae]QND70804.1 hypothetical protein HB776_05825 [Tardiphaga robiniae]